MNNSNGDITYEVCIGGSKTVVKTVRGRITPKRVKTANRTWDRNGRRVSSYHPAQMVTWLLSYRIDGGEEVQIAKTSNVEVRGD